MSGTGRLPRMRHSVALALPLVLGVPGCLAAGWFELTRARAGHLVAWAYVVEWPLFAVAGAYIWWQLRPGRTEEGRSGVRPEPPVDATPDAQTVAWQDYVTVLQLLDPPGQPPDPSPSPRTAGARRRPGR